MNDFSVMTVKFGDKKMLVKVDQRTGNVEEVVSVKKSDRKDEAEKSTVSQTAEEKRAAEMKSEQESVARSTQETIKANITTGDFANAKTAYNMAAMFLSADQLKELDYLTFDLARNSLDPTKANEAYLRAMGRTTETAETKTPFGFDQATA